MDIEIVVLGESSKWVLNQPRIRIGEAPGCEVGLPAGKYPAVAGEHVTLEVAEGAVRLRQGSGESFLNGHAAGTGATVRSGDVLRLGAGGPELRIGLLGRATVAGHTAHEPTRVIAQPTVASHQPTRVISGPSATVYSPAPARQLHATQAAHVSTPQAQPVQAAAAHAAESGNMNSLEGKLKTLRLILLANLALVVLLCVWIFLQGQELAQTHRDLQALRAQAQTAVGQVMPQLDDRLNAFDQRMDGMDAKIATAQDRMVKGMDAEAKVAEDRMVNRMNAEIPTMLDKYVARKMSELRPR
jgi:hypothetical protein